MAFRWRGGFDAFKPIYMKMTAKGLDPSDSYDGPYVGGMGGGDGTLGGDGNFIVGIHGKTNDNRTSVQALSLVSLTVNEPAGGLDPMPKKTKKKRIP